MTITPVIHWFRQDLRIHDNPALFDAARAGSLIPIYIVDDESAGQHKLGSASRLWLHHSLLALNATLNGNLHVFSGRADVIIPQLVKQHKVQAVYWNRCYEPWRRHQDDALETHLHKKGINVNTYNSALLWEPWEILKKDDKPYRVFTPFYKAALAANAPDLPLNIPTNLQYARTHMSNKQDIVALGLHPKQAWGSHVLKHWSVGEKAALAQLERFLSDGIAHYKTGRDTPSQSYVSRLSPYLHFGEISPRFIWDKVKQLFPQPNENSQTFLKELGWREFSYYLLYHFPQLPEKNLQPKFDRFPWIKSLSQCKAWQTGMTGYPIIDAGMRQLWETGWMHNRVRMITASFLVKNLRLHWHDGAVWFWDCLVDADLASNSASWQWVAGCGTDAAPYFRIFNPILQAKKFDPQGDYIRRYVPELRDLPNRYLFAPWEAPETILKKANVTLGKTYPKPLVSLSQSRQQALEAFKSL